MLGENCADSDAWVFVWAVLIAALEGWAQATSGLGRRESGVKSHIEDSGNGGCQFSCCINNKLRPFLDQRPYCASKQ